VEKRVKSQRPETELKPQISQAAFVIE